MGIERRLLPVISIDSLGESRDPIDPGSRELEASSPYLFRWLSNISEFAVWGGAIAYHALHIEATKQQKPLPIVTDETIGELAQNQESLTFYFSKSSLLPEGILEDRVNKHLEALVDKYKVSNPNLVSNLERFIKSEITNRVEDPIRLLINSASLVTLEVLERQAEKDLETNSPTK